MIAIYSKQRGHSDLNHPWQLYVQQNDSHRDLILSHLWRLDSESTVTAICNGQSDLNCPWQLYLQLSATTTEIWMAYDNYLQQSDTASETRTTSDNYLVFTTNWHKHRDLITYHSYLQQSDAATEIWITYDSYIRNKMTQPQKRESPMTAVYATTTQPTQTWTAYAHYHLACQWM